MAELAISFFPLCGKKKGNIKLVFKILSYLLEYDSGYNTGKEH